MLKRASLLALALSLGTAAQYAASATESDKPAVTKDVQAELSKLKKAVGAGELSSKEYQARKAALLAGEQTAKADGK